MGVTHLFSGITRRFRQEKRRDGLGVWRGVKVVGEGEVVLVDEKPISEYYIGKVKVTVYPTMYVAREPHLSQRQKEVIARLMSHIYYSVEPEHVLNAEEPPTTYLEKLLWKSAAKLGLQSVIADFFDSALYYIKRDIIGYGPIDVLLRDPEVEEVSFIGYSQPVFVIHRRALSHSRWLPTNIVLDEDDARGIIQKMAQRGRSHVSAAFPISDLLLPEGHRAAVSYGREVTPTGFTFTIRKFPQKPLTIIDLLRNHTLTPLIASYLWTILRARGFIIIIGATASGKTTLLNALAQLIPMDWKIVTVEDTPEIRIGHPQWDRLVSRKTLTIEGTAPEIDLFELTKFAWRRRPDFLIVGEVRGREVRALVHAVASGHGGMTTFHASSARSAMLRLMSPPLSVEKAFLMLISCFVTMREIRSGVRVLYRVEELDEELNPTTVYKYGEPVDPALLVRRSRVLKEVGRVWGLDEDGIRRLIEEQKSLLERAVEMGSLKALIEEAAKLEVIRAF